MVYSLTGKAYLQEILTQALTNLERPKDLGVMEAEGDM
jgi:hypothetical protein